MADHGQAFDVVDRWRFEPGELGAGIRELLATGTELISDVLDAGWRRDYEQSDRFDPPLRAVSDAYARLIQDEVIAVARFARALDHPNERDDIARLLELRLWSGWYSYCLDINDRLGLDAPEVVFP